MDNLAISLLLNLLMDNLTFIRC